MSARRSTSSPWLAAALVLASACERETAPLEATARTTTPTADDRAVPAPTPVAPRAKPQTRAEPIARTEPAAPPEPEPRPDEPRPSYAELLPPPPTPKEPYTPPTTDDIHAAAAIEHRESCERHWPRMESPSLALTKTCARYWVIHHGYGGRADADFGLEPTIGGPAFIKLDARTSLGLAHRVQTYCGIDCAPIDARAIELFRTSGSTHYALRERGPDGLALGPLFRTILDGKPLEDAAVHYDLEPDETIADRLATLSAVSLFRLRNAVYAHHGRPFSQPDLQAFFYGEVPSFISAHADADPEGRAAAGLPRTPDPTFDESQLTPTDHATIALIRRIERAPRPEP